MQAAQDLVSNAERTLQGAGLSTQAMVLDGDPREALVEAAKSERADLLVVGSHGRTGLAKLLMGSVASHVVAHAPCTVTVVKRAH
jgi:nucleotide-binding universal stress UspA family protein